MLFLRSASRPVAAWRSVSLTENMHGDQERRHTCRHQATAAAVDVVIGIEIYSVAVSDGEQKREEI
jgi:hypothetical protein